VSIGYKKVTELINLEVGEISQLSAKQKDSLSGLCAQLYMLESSSEYQSVSRLTEEMLGVIGNAAAKFEGGI